MFYATNTLQQAITNTTQADRNPSDCRDPKRSARPRRAAAQFNQAVVAGQTATFSVDVAGGYDAFTAQWRANGTNISGAIGGSYTTGPTTASDNGTAFSVVINNIFNGSTVTSAVAILTVNVPPSITAQPTEPDQLPEHHGGF
jgi:hypothetical protein